MVSALLYHCIFCVALLMDLFVLRVYNACKLFGKTIRHIFGCGCSFVVVCYGGVECVGRCSAG